jgi:hypothetical protein
MWEPAGKASHFPSHVRMRLGWPCSGTSLGRLVAVQHGDDLEVV